MAQNSTRSLLDSFLRMSLWILLPATLAVGCVTIRTGGPSDARLAKLAAGEKGTGVQVWAADPLIKIFRDAKPGETLEEAVAEVARGEHATLQVIARSDAAIEGLTATLGPLRLERGWTKLAADTAQVRFVQDVQVAKPTPQVSSLQLRKPPAAYPDYLDTGAPVAVKPGEAQAVWVTLPIAQDAAPGVYRGHVRLSGRAEGRDFAVEFPVAVRVYAATVGKSRLWITNWFQMNSLGRKDWIEPYSDRYWNQLRAYARNMAAHRQNTALLSPLDLAEFSVQADGSLGINFDRFDRAVQIMMDEGVIGRIEGGHIGWRVGDWEGPFNVQIVRVRDGQAVREKVEPSSAEADAFYARFFPALVAHLREKGWLGQYMQHLADEPVKSNIESYRALSALAQKHAPELRVIEACHTKDLAGAIQVWVPQFNFWHDDYTHYQERQRQGDEVWFYTCMFPQGEYANRFIEQPLVLTRLLHWLNFRYGATGYLHWGYNWWQGDPFVDTIQNNGSTYQPAGDSYIIYPGPDGQPLDSIRIEAMRDGIADYELLSQLADRDADAAQRLAQRLILDFNRYETSVPAFRQARRELLEAVGK